MKYCSAVFFILFSITLSIAQKIAGPLLIAPGVQEGYTLFAPLNTKKTYLIDNCGRVINQWESQYFPGNTLYLHPDGNLVRTCRIPNSVITGGGGGGGIEIFDWKSNLLWSFNYNTELVRQHHDISLLPNGNILILAWQLKNKDQSLAAGRNPALLVDDVIWSEEIIEVKPVFPNTAEIVWKWNLWDHLIQDFDPNKANYGSVSDHPELIDLNYTMAEGIDDWIHANSIDYNEDLDQIVISSPFLNEFWIIDHSTTTSQAAGHAGGNSNKGGDILYRWGNPRTYKSGTIADQKLFGQHHVHWIKNNLPHGGKIMFFNNNAGSGYSSVEIMQPLQSTNGDYLFSGNTFGPNQTEWTYLATPPEKLFSRIMSGAEILPNGNVLICSSLQGKFLEIKSDLDTVWEYKSPITVNGTAGRDFTPPDSNFGSDPIFRCIKYPPDYPAFANKNLQPGEPIEGEPWASCELVTALTNEAWENIEIYPNPVRNYLIIKSNRHTQRISVRLLAIQGKEIKNENGIGELKINFSTVPSGVYIIIVNNIPHKILKLD